MTFVFMVELISYHPNSEDLNIDVEVDTYEIEGADEESAVIVLKETFNTITEHYCQSIGSYECYGTIDSETF